MMTPEAGSVPANAIDEGFVPRVRPDVIFVELDGELVITACLNDDDQQFDTHWLDRIASVIWRCFDGQSSLGDLADDLSKAFDADRDTVLRDVVSLTRTLGEGGLLEGVARRVPLGPAQPEGIPVGTPIPVHQLVDLSSAPMGESDREGRARLLVNWSAGCGHCLQIAPQLAALQPALDARDVELVLVASGSAEANEELRQQTGLTCRMVSARGFHPFSGLGTPVAYLVDATGSIAADLVTGAAQVLALAHRLAGRLDEQA
jgi:thiol-disulfide isomerase/thioredoxin